MTAHDHELVADALLEARRLTDRLTLDKDISRQSLAVADAKLRRAIEIMDRRDAR